jgi:hypothetical protein
VEILPHVSEIVHALDQADQKNEWVAEIDKILWDLTKRWREYFIKYLEVGRFVSVEREMPLPEEAKKRLTEAVARSLEKEIK